jgi:hypothetical protein
MKDQMKNILDFPRIAMTVTQRIAGYTSGVPVIDLTCTVYEPMTASTFFSICAAKRYRCKTTFVGATVPAAKHPRASRGWPNSQGEMEERIRGIALRNDGEITGTAERAE